MDKQIVFEDEQIRVIFLAGHSDELVLSFGDLITRAKGLSINAEKSLVKYDYNVIGIMPKEKSWFPLQSMMNMLPAIEPYLAKFNQIIGYGGSMGGYAVLKYAKLLQMTRAIAFVPQYSIDPQQVEDRRYAEFFDISLHRDMQISANDVSLKTDYIIVYDPYYSNDREHYLKIKSIIPQVLTLKLPFTGHEALAVLASSSLLNDFIRHDLDAQYFYTQMRTVKKNSKFYYRTVISQLMSRHSKALGRILKNNDLQLDAQYLDPTLKQLITRVMLSRRQVTEQDLQKLGIKVNLPQESRLHLQDQFEGFLIFNMISSKIESYSQDSIRLNDKYLIPLAVQSSGLVKVDINHERYLVAMNDRHVMKLVKEHDPLSLDMTPLVLKKHEQYYVISYKGLALSSDDQGVCHFIDSAVDKSTHFVLV